MAKYSFVVPIFNDGYLAGEFCEEYLGSLQGHLGTDDISGQSDGIMIHPLRPVAGAIAAGL